MFARSLPSLLAALLALSLAPLAAAQFGGNAPVLTGKAFARLDGKRVKVAIKLVVPPNAHLWSWEDRIGGAGTGLSIKPSGSGIRWNKTIVTPKPEIYPTEVWGAGPDPVEVLAEVFYGEAVFYATGTLEEGDALPNDLKVEVAGQFCTEGEGGACYEVEDPMAPGQGKPLTLISTGAGDDKLFASFPGAKAFDPNAKPDEQPTTPPDGKGGDEPEQPAAKGGSKPEQTRDSSLLAFLLAAVGAGLFALVMPCTYPMIPITISFFSKQSEKGSAVVLSLAYGAGIVLMFASLGVLAGSIAGAADNIVNFSTHWITNLVIGVVFVIFAFSLFGCYELRPPAFMMNAANSAQSTGGLLGVFLMGATLVITSFTCTAPFVGALLAGALTGGMWKCVLGMTVFGLTMAIPFVLLSLLPGKASSMPRAGQWMATIKVSMGFVELAAALKFLSNAELTMNSGQGLGILPYELFLLLWAAIAMALAFYLLGVINLKGESSDGIGPGRLAWGTIFVLLATYFAFGAMGYQVDEITTAIAPPYNAERLGAAAPAEGGSSGGHAHGGHTIVEDDFDKALAVAREKGKKLLVNFTGVT